MNFLQRATLGGVSGLNLNVKKVGNQQPLVEGYRDGLPVLQPYAVRSALEKDMPGNPFLYTAMRKKADAIASVPFYVEEFKDGEWTRVPNHPAENLIENANPFMSGAELKRLLVYHKELTGSAYMQIVKVRDIPQFLQPLFPQYTKVIPSQSNFIEGFEYSIDGERRKLKSNEVFWTKHAHPADPYRGLSPLESISGEVQTDLEARRWNKISLANRGASDVAFIMRDVVTQEQYEFARMMIEDRISGPDNARRPWVLGGDSDVRPLSYTAVEMDYINTRKFNREVISAALGVPAPLIGDADNSTYNNLDTLTKDFWHGTISSWLEDLRQDLTRQVLIPFYGDKRVTKSPTLRYAYDFSAIEALTVHVSDKAETAKSLREAGYSLRAINQMLEFGVDMDEEDRIAEVEAERERATLEASRPEPAPALEPSNEAVAERMARIIAPFRKSPKLFASGVNAAVAEITKSAPSEFMTEADAEHMDSVWIDGPGDHFEDYVAEKIVSLCRR